jgi:hypothetical protein
MHCTKQENASVNDGIWKLLRILGTWETARQQHTANTSLPNGVTLEINAYSPSDTEHWFKNFYFTSTSDANIEDNCKTDDPGHGWINGQQVFPPPADAIPRLFSNICFSFPEKIPPVSSITSLIIRRRLRRSLFPGSLGFLLKQLNAVEHLVYEPWRQWENRSTERHDRCKWTTVSLSSHHSLDS